MNLHRAVAPGDTLRLRYALRLPDGSEVVSNFDDPEAETLTLGDGTLAPGLEHWLVGVEPGTRHVFLLEPWQAFGEPDPARIHTLPRADLPPGHAFEVDQLVEFSMPNGQTLPGQILEVRDDGIRVDFNHPLAGLALEFEVEVECILLPE